MSKIHVQRPDFRLGERLVEPALNRIHRPDRGEPIEIEPKVMEVLCVLAAHPGEVVTREQLLEEVWGGRIVVDEALTRCISILRDVLGDDTGTPRFIQTIRKRGYRLLVQPEEVARASTTAAANGDAEPRGQVGGSGGENTVDVFRMAGRSRRTEPDGGFWRAPRPRLVVPLLFVAIVLAVAIKLDSSKAERVDSIAVLPLAVDGDEEALTLIASGFTESLIAGLTDSPELKVIARDSAELIGAEADPQAAGRRLGAAAVVHGTVRREGEQVSVFARAVRTIDGRILWAQRVRGAPGDPALEEALSRALQARFRDDGKATPPAARTANAAAHRRYLEGRFLWNRRTGQSLDAAARRFEEAIALDPDYAAAHAALAQTHLLRSYFGSHAPIEVMPLAKQAAERALALDDSIGAAHAVLATIRYQYEWDWAGAERGFQRAITLDPNDATTYQWYGELLQWRGRFEEARAQYRKALELDPLSLVIQTSLAGPELWGGDYAAAQRALRQVLELDPNFSYAIANFGLALLFQGDLDGALRQFERAQELFGDDAVFATLAYAQARAGGEEAAREALMRLRRLVQAGEYVAPFRFAVVYMGLGETEAALDWLERAVTARDEHLVGLALEPRFADLRGHPRFAEILARIGLSQRAEPAAPPHPKAAFVYLSDSKY